MGAHPKNKITRAERGKRRAGNTPSLAKDAKITAVPLHKRGLVASILAAAGLAPAKATQTSKRSTEKQTDQSHQGLDARNLERQAARSQSAVLKTTRKTQHKG
jgi:hypothetical protein